MIFGAYVPNIDVGKDNDMTSVIDHIVQWVTQYPQKIRVCHKKENEMLALDRYFLCKFIEVRRGFHLPRENPVYQKNLNGIIQLDHIFEKYDCSLDDLLTVYKIFYQEVQSLTKKEIKGCDSIIKGMGLDKERSAYFHYSRSFLSDKDRQDSISRHEEEGDCEFVYVTDPDDIAVKSLMIYKLNPEDTAAKITFNYDVKHCQGELQSKLPQPDSNGEGGGQLILNVCFENTDYSGVEDYKYRNIQELIKNTIQGKNELAIQVIDQKENIIPCRFVIEMYKDLSQKDVGCGVSDCSSQKG